MGTSWRSCVLVLVLLVSSAPTSAYRFDEPSFETKARLASVVVIGRVTSVAGTDVRVVTVQRYVALKGAIAKEFSFDHRNTLVEKMASCCDVGALYVFFLFGNYGIGYAPIEGQRAIMKIDPATGDADDEHTGYPLREPTEPVSRP